VIIWLPPAYGFRSPVTGVFACKLNTFAIRIYNKRCAEVGVHRMPFHKLALSQDGSPTGMRSGIAASAYPGDVDAGSPIGICAKPARSVAGLPQAGGN
jgi:hypothetical protein